MIRLGTQWAAYLIGCAIVATLVASACNCATAPKPAIAFEKDGEETAIAFTRADVAKDPYVAVAYAVFDGADLRATGQPRVVFTDSVSDSGFVGCVWLSKMKTLVCANADEMAVRIEEGMERMKEQSPTKEDL